jgi:hypothetical protein
MHDSGGCCLLNSACQILWSYAIQKGNKGVRVYETSQSKLKGARRPLLLTKRRFALQSADGEAVRLSDCAMTRTDHHRELNCTVHLLNILYATLAQYANTHTTNTFWKAKNLSY